MHKAFLLILLLLSSLTTLVSANELVLDLDQKVDAQVLPHSRYHVDTTGSLTLSNIKRLGDHEWEKFSGKQFGRGFMSSPLWIKTTLRTVGQTEREIVLQTHQVMDHMQLEVTTEGGATQYFKLGRGTAPGPHHLKGVSNLNHAVIHLQPDKRYSILLGIDSDNPVVGGFRVTDSNTLSQEVQKQTQWITTFLLLILLLSFYNFVIYLSTLNKAFLFHVCYVACITSYLLNDYGYLSNWLGIYDVFILQKLTAFSLVGAYLSIVYFFDTMNEVNAESVIISRINKLLISGGYLLLLLTFILPYEYVIRMLSAQVLIAVAAGIFNSIYREKHFGKSDQTHQRILRVLLITLAPSVTLYMLNRLGVIDVAWHNDFILFMSTFVEVVLVSLILFVAVRQSKDDFKKELFFNSVSNLPNGRALQSHFEESSAHSKQTLIQIWISGLDKLEVAFGSDVYKHFISEIKLQIQRRLQHNALLIPLADKQLGSFPLFHTDKNIFTLLCKSLDANTRHELQKQISQSIESIGRSHHKSLQFNLVIGAHDYIYDVNDFETVVKNSLLALSYGIKNNKKFKYYNPQIGFDEQKRVTLVNGFTESLNNNEFYLLWQPQYRTRDKKLSGVEVLTRWHHPQYGTISPEEFITTLEQSQRICDLSQWVIGEVFNQLPLLHEKHPGLEVSINLSPQDLMDDRLVHYIDSLSDQFAQYCEFVTLEITESLLIDDYSRVLSTIEDLKKRGFKISIDDFGSGYASFAYLQKLPANELKIDKSYTDLYREQTTYAILETIIELAKRLDMRIVVEGIEHQQQIDLFTNLGAERLQGWMLDKPMSLQSLMSKT
ncbi:EAL domain-containing protein [Leucothrix pacifica]|uniref:EAL domain-containing protein n=1 Tax=Leucothrix pacifica TaxID=1247513 RepID=A0A317CQY0_9GAMM|nr:EAL domain-containing protein [Leucothrix pacifica]PWR00680.1 hypothetical protein DKW60_00280 [Leucothrix pacifica]